MRLSITAKIGVVLLVPTGAALLALGVFYSFLSHTAADAAAINVSGRQRMLAQQVRYFAHMAVVMGRQEFHQRLVESMGKFDRSLDVLEHGGITMGRDLPPASLGTLDEIAAVKQLWQKHRQALRVITAGSATDSLVKNAYGIVESNTPLLLQASDDVVSAFEARNLALQQRMFNTLITVFTLDLLLLVAGILVIKRYVGQRRRTETMLRRQSQVIDQIHDSVVSIDMNGYVKSWNKGAERLFGYSLQEMLDKHISAIYPEDGREFFEDQVMAPLKAKGVHEAEVRMRRKSGEIFFAHLSLSLLRDNMGLVTGMVGYSIDITERKRFEERLQFLAHHDPLTGLPNRALFFDRLNQAMARVRWHKRLVAVLFLDLDRFKLINDTMGHDIGDRLLKSTAQRLSGLLRDGDTVARIGGDEFTIVLTDIAEKMDIPKLARTILAEMDKPFVIDGREVFTTVSIGISFHPGDGDSAETLVTNADIAMYCAKDLGRDNYQFYSSAMDTKAPERLALEIELRHALERKELLVYYQPKVDLRSGNVTGMEALMRWRHQTMGLVQPAMFISLLEENGQIVPVGEWILHTTCAQNKSWQDAGLPKLCVAVNLSARQFRQQDFAEVVERILEETGLAAKYLELELTESVLMENLDQNTAALHKLNAMGIRITLDDFGTGYSSLSYLKRFPIDFLKIDRSFVRDINSNEDDAALTQAIIAMAHNLKIKVVAEGVETFEQLSFLRANQCDEMQGYYFSHPLPAEEFAQLLKSGKSLEISAHKRVEAR